MLANSRIRTLGHSPARRALRVHVQRVKRVARRHEQAVAMAAAEADICAAFGQSDLSDRLAGRVEDANAIELRRHAPAPPQNAVDLPTKTPRGSVRPPAHPHKGAGRRSGPP